MLRRRKYENDTSENVPPLDSDEQEEVVRSLVCKAERQSETIKRAFRFFLALFALAAASSLFQFRRAFTEPLIERTALDILWDAGLIVMFVGHVFGLYVAREITKDNRRHAFLGLVVSLTNAFVWIAVLVWRRATNSFLYWIPLCPVVAIGLSLYISISERKLKSELEDLKRAQYNHKKL